MAIKTYKVGKVMVDANDLGEVNNAALNITIDVAEKTKIGDTWKEQLALGKNWNLSASLLYDPDDTAQAALRTEFISGDGDIASLKMYEDAAKYFSGVAIITSFNIVKAINAPDALSVTFEGSGALSYT